jgi:cytoskeletal protein RodZ
MGSKSKSRTSTSTSTSNRTSYDTRNSAISGDLDEGSIAASGNGNISHYQNYDGNEGLAVNGIGNSATSFNYEDADFSRNFGDVEESSIALQGVTNSGNLTINSTSDKALEVVQSTTLAAIRGISDTAKEGLNETIEGLTHLSAGIAKNDAATNNVKYGVIAIGGVLTVAAIAASLRAA